MTSLFTHLSMYILVISMSQLLLMLLQCMLVGILLVVQPLLLPCKTETVPMSHPVPFPLSQPLTPSILLSVNMEPTALGTLYEWTQTSFALCVWLMSLSIMPSGFTHAVAYVSALPSFQAGQHSLCGWTMFCLSIPLLRDTWNIYIHLSRL